VVEESAQARSALRAQSSRVSPPAFTAVRGASLCCRAELGGRAAFSSAPAAAAPHAGVFGAAGGRPGCRRNCVCCRSHPRVLSAAPGSSQSWGPKAPLGPSPLPEGPPPEGGPASGHLTSAPSPARRASARAPSAAVGWASPPPAPQPPPTVGVPTAACLGGATSWPQCSPQGQGPPGSPPGLPLRGSARARCSFPSQLRARGQRRQQRWREGLPACVRPNPGLCHRRFPRVRPL
jgi:hypothetical protein